MGDLGLLLRTCGPFVMNTALPVLLAVVAPALMFHRVYFGSAGQHAYFYGDTTGSYWPDLVYFVRTLAQGEVPLWNPNERGGIPFAFDPQPGVLYPLNWILALVALAVGHTPFSLFEVKILAHLSLATLGWYSWARLRFSPAAALVGAVAGGLGLYTIQNTHFGLIWPITWVPWALFSLDRCLSTGRLGFALAFATSVGALFTAGSPPGALYGALVIAAFGIPEVVRNLLRSDNCTRRRLLLLGLLGLTLACIFAAPVIFGTSSLTQFSVLEKRGYAYYADSPLWLSNITALIFPATHGLSMYAGVAIATLAVVGILSGPVSVLSLSALGVGALGLLTALGDQTPVAGWLYAQFPPVRYFRLIFRYLYLLQAALAVLATLGAAELLSPAKRNYRALGVVTLLAVGVTALCALATAGELPAAKQAAPRWLEVRNWVLAVWVAALVSFYVRVRLARYISLCGVILADLALVVPTANTLRSGVFSLPDQISSGMLSTILDETPQYRVWDEFALAYRPGSRIGVRDLRGYMDPLRLAHYDTMVAHLSKAPLQLARWNVRWVLPAPLPFLGASHSRVNVRRLTSAMKLEPHVLELPHPRPVAIFTTRVQVPSSEEQLWAALDRDPPGAPVQLPPLNQWAYTHDELSELGKPLRATTDVPASVLARGANSLSISVQAPTDGWLVVNEAYFPGWVAEVDGVSTPIYRVDGWVRGLRIAKGSHRVELCFRPIAWLVLASLAVIAWLGSLACLALVMTRKARGCRRGAVRTPHSANVS
jgi:hypothetical protein